MNARSILQRGIGFRLAGHVMPAVADTPAAAEQPPPDLAPPCRRPATSGRWQRHGDRVPGRHHCQRIGRTSIRIILGSLLLLNGVWAETSVPPSETAATQLQIKAAFLYNFAKFTTWPTNALPATPGALVIGVWGADPFGPLLDRTVAGKQFGDRPIIVKRCATTADARACPLLFISAAEAARLDELLRGLAGAPVVTVSDLKDFSARGGMIEFVAEGSRIAFKINKSAADRVGVIFSSKLLRLAREVLQPPTGDKEKR